MKLRQQIRLFLSRSPASIHFIERRAVRIASLAATTMLSQLPAEPCVASQRASMRTALR